MAVQSLLGQHRQHPAQSARIDLCIHSDGRVVRQNDLDRAGSWRGRRHGVRYWVGWLCAAGDFDASDRAMLGCAASNALRHV